MPIRNIKFEIIGVFQVLNKKEGDFTEADEDVLLRTKNFMITTKNSLIFKFSSRVET